jgi:uncharacterized membrane protein
MIDYPHIILHNISVVIAICALLIMVWGVVLTLVRMVYSEINKRGKLVMHNLREELRIKLGSYILLGLEVLIVADVVESVSDPSVEELYRLGGIVLIRTVMGFFLEKELQPHEDHLWK